MATAAKDSKKRKQTATAGATAVVTPKEFKKRKSDAGESATDKRKKSFKTKHAKPDGKNPKEQRLNAKEMAEARKRKRKPYYNLEKELAQQWEKMRRTNISKEEKSKLISDAVKKMSGKTLEIASSHVAARVLQTCVKYCSQQEREKVYEELQPHLLTLSRKKYSVHLVKKLLDTASKKQLEAFFSSVRGNIAFLLRHSVASSVIEHAYQLGNGSQKQALLLEVYSPGLQLFRDLTQKSTGRLIDIIPKYGLQKASVVQHMTTVIQPLLEKGILDYSIIHTALMEFFSIADKSSAVDVIQQLLPLLLQESKKKKLREPRLIRMIHSKDGLKVANLCIKHGSAKERKKIIKAMKDYVRRLAFDHHGSLMLICILSVVDDTKLLTKIIISELQTDLKDLILDKNGRRLLLELLHPHCSRYLSPEELAFLDVTVPSVSSQGVDAEAVIDIDTSGNTASSEPDVAVLKADDDYKDKKKSAHLVIGGKKDPSLCRHELLVDSGLAESLIETCAMNVGELIRSNFGREVIYEVAVGGSDHILQKLAKRLEALHGAIASLAAVSKIQGSEEEHAFENFHSSRTIRRLVLDCPSFAATLWKTALVGKSEVWAQGHSCKVVSAFLESSDGTVRELAKSELQPLVDRGILNISENKKTT